MLLPPGLIALVHNLHLRDLGNLRPILKRRDLDYDLPMLPTWIRQTSFMRLYSIVMTCAGFAFSQHGEYLVQAQLQIADLLDQLAHTLPVVHSLFLQVPQ